MKPRMTKGLIRALCALLTALALYSLLGFLILPGIASVSYTHLTLPTIYSV